MNGHEQYPFAVLTAVVAPAILTNACSVLALGTSNRIARVVDRTRTVAAAKSSIAAESPDHQVYTRQLDRLTLRGNLLLKALRLFYGSLGAFAASALLAVVGSVLTAYDFQIGFRTASVFGLVVGSGGVSGLVYASILMVRETRLAIRNMAEEAEFAGKLNTAAR
jgi:hypothetical protein